MVENNKKKLQLIPRKIHYCWFGGKPLPESVKKCIESWRKYCPDYEIIQWNEKDVEIQNFDFMKVAYENKKWAFVSDYARYKILYENGGIYLDTDVELIKNLDDLLNNKAYMGFESNEYVNTGLGFGAIKGHPLLLEILDFYNQVDLRKHLEDINKVTTPIIVTNILNKHGLLTNGELQDLGDIMIFPTDYFSPKSPFTRIINRTDNTYSIHQFDATWVNKEERKYIDKLEKHAKELAKKQKVLVSIIIPVFNGEKYLREAIDSALSQTYKNIEVIVINDGSADKTEEIAKSYGSRIRYFKKENGGVSSALNMGLEKMRGYYFSWLSHDDKYYPEKIEKQVAYARKFDDKTIVISNWTIINANGEFIEDKHLDSRLEKLPTCFLAFDRKTWLNGCAMLIPKTIFEEFGNFNETLKSTQDYDMWFRISRRIQFKVLTDCLLYSRAHLEQGSLTLPTAIEDSDSIHSRILDNLSTEEIEEYFKNNIKEIWTVYDSFFNNGYKKTPANILKVIIKKLIEEGDYQETDKILREKLIGEINSDKSFDKRIKVIINQIQKKKKKKRLFFCSAHWFTGGVERVLSNLFEELKEDYEIILITPHTEQEGRIKLPKGILHIEVSDFLFYNHYDFVILTYALLLDVDVVIGCMNLFEKILNFYKLAKGCKFKTVASNHEYYFYPYHSPYFYQIVRKREEAFSMVDVSICLTNFNAAVSNIYNNNNSFLIPNPNTFQVQDNDISIKDEKIILCVGRFNDQVKRIDRILKCFKKVLEEIPDAKLILVGKCDRNLPFSSENDKTIMDLQTELGLSGNNVSFVGEVGDMVNYYSEASVLLMTSNSEGFSMVLNEAACFGVPTVSNYIPGLEDIISDGINGYIVPQDDLETMANRVSNILSNNSLRVKLGKNAKKLAERFSVEKIYEKWVILIETLTANYSPEDQKKILHKDLGFEIQNYKNFANSVCKELNSIFYDNLNSNTNRDNSQKQRTGVMTFEVRSSIKAREVLIDKIIKFIISIREKGLKVTFKILVKRRITVLFEFIKKCIRKSFRLFYLIKTQGVILTAKNIFLKFKHRINKQEK